ELPAPIAGKVTRVLKKKGDKATVGEVIGYMEAGAAGASAAPSKPEGGAKSDGASKPAPAPAKQEMPAKTDAQPAPGAPKRETVVMPAAARALATGGVDPAAVTPTGPGGRMLKEDV